MKNFIKAVSLICCLSLMLTVLGACGGEKKTVKKVPYTVGSVSNVAESDVVENESFSLSFDAQTANILITDKATGNIYSQIPYEYYLANRESLAIAQNTYMPGVEVPSVAADYSAVSVYSPIHIDALEMSSNTTTTFYADPEVFRRGRVGSKLIENGIRVTYYFDALQISVPVEYTIDSDSFNIRVVPTEVAEGNDEYRILTAALSPMFCSAVNSAESYLVIPSGSGTLMYTDVRTDSTVRTYSAEVYGHDPAVEYYEKLNNSEEIRLPMFGVVEGTRAVCAIIEQGSEKCTINANAGDTVSGYSTAYISFRIRGYNEPVSTILAGRIRVRTHIKDDITSSEPVCIAYHLLSGDKANYTGIAECYRDYLITNEGLGSEATSSLLYTKILGGFQSDELFLGIPYKKTKSLTTYDEAADMTNQLSELVSGSLAVEMSGFGTTGVAVGEVGGGFKLTGVNGNKKSLKNFVAATAELGVKTYFDFDIVRFKDGAGGFDDTAVTANNAASKQYKYNLSTKLRETDDYYYLLQRSQLDAAAEKANSVAEKYGITGVAFESLGSIAYSDYVDSKYYNKEGSAEQTVKILSSVKDSKKSVAVNEANAYAAVAADTVFDVPTKSDMNASFDRDIPLYQIVFKGYVDIANESINTAENQRTQFLKAVETGTGLSFTLTANYSVDTTLAGESVFYATNFDDNKDVIKGYLDEAGAYLKAVGSAKIVSHETVAENTVKTVFDNGVYVYVNYGDVNTLAEGITVAANGFAAFTKEGTVIE